MHGGDIYNNKVNMDFSVNINPLGLPPMVKEAFTESLDNITCYPEYGANSLKAAIADKVDCGPNCIVCGNGASELIMAVVNAIRPSKVLIPVPAFSGYERAVRALVPECEIEHIILSENHDYRVDEMVPRKIRDYAPELVFVTNPGNPTGRLIEPEILQDIVDACGEVDSFLVIDECFLPLTGWEYDTCLNDKVIIIKAFTKAYAIPGLRLGFCKCLDEELAARIEAVLPEWNISVPAIEAGKAALKEKGYIEASVRLIEEERDYLKSSLEELGCRTYVSDANYLVFRIGNTDDEINDANDNGNVADTEGDDGVNTYNRPLHERLIRRGILIRDCSDYEGMGSGFYRIAVKRHEDNVRLIEAIEALL